MKKILLVIVLMFTLAGTLAYVDPFGMFETERSFEIYDEDGTLLSKSVWTYDNKGNVISYDVEEYE